MSPHKIIVFFYISLTLACSGKKAPENEQTGLADSLVNTSKMGMFDADRQFLKKYHRDLIELELGKARALICPAYQGRVMTTTSDGETSYGWINYELIRSGKLQLHMNAFGGEDRFWLGPEGGQFALYFKKGDPFDATHWQTPAVIDSEPFSVKSVTPSAVTFFRDFVLTNYAGTQLNVGVERIVTLLSASEIERLLEVPTDSLNVIGIQSDNVITNRGSRAWEDKTGMPSIWILSMMNASPTTTIIVPFKPGDAQPINDTYFGKVPAERLIVGETSALFKADAQYRSKIGVSPDRATNWVGSYDSKSATLTLVTFDFDGKNQRYVNSAWEIQKDPYAGDVINAYNDGPMQPGQQQMGNFYELESSSPAANLAPKARLRHRHTIFHVQGTKDQLNQLAKRLLHTDLTGLNQ